MNRYSNKEPIDFSMVHGALCFYYELVTVWAIAYLVL